LRFGASNHSSHAWHWLQPAFGYDPVGAMAGVRYDGYNQRSQGKGMWWDGFDPQELYVGPSIVLPDGMKTEKEAEDWHKTNDGHWFETPPPKYPGFTNSWFLRTQELVAKYDLDFLYFDDTELPFGDTGLDVVADFYNRNISRRGGKLEACVFAKGFKPEHLGAAVLDIERGRSNDILPLPWQTDTCIGDWHYNINVFNEHRYKSAKTVIQLLADIVSKNGNLMLNIPLKGDGTIDSDELKVLNELATWFPANGEAIYGTRPFKISGEGPPDVVTTGNFNEGKGRAYTSEDMRFTVKDGRLYAIVMAWPADGKVRVKSLAKGSPYFGGEVAKVELLGAGGLRFERQADALEVTLPGRQPNELPFALRVTPGNASMFGTQ
jgi:alpha-L-fucosidase